MLRLVKVLKISVVVLFCLSTISVSAQTLLQPTLEFGTSACDDAATKKDFIITIRVGGSLFNSDNEYQIQLSDANGVFDDANPTIVRRITDAGVNGNFNPQVSFQLPDGVFGTAYRIRVVADKPAATSPPSVAFAAYDLIGDGPTLFLEQLNAIICQGETFTIVIADSQGKTGLFQWFKDGVMFATTNEPQLTVSEMGEYYATIDYGVCSERETQRARISGLSNADGQIKLPTTSPFEICATDTVDFEANTNNTTIYNYQWIKDGIPISGATSPLYTTPNVGQLGSYTLTTSSKDGSCSVTSDPVVVQQQTGASFTLTNQGDSNPILMPCEVIELEVSGFPASATFQWFKDGVEERNRTFSTINVNVSGDYILRVTEPGTTGSCDVVVDSEPFRVRDLAAFVDFEIRYDNTLYQECNESSAKLVIVGFKLRDTDGNEKDPTDAQLNPVPPQDDLIVLQWIKDGTITSVAGNSIDISSFQENGDYELEIRSCSPAFAVSNRSNRLPVKLTIPDPIITSVPNSDSLCPGDTISYTIDTLVPGFTYEWYKDTDTVPFATNVQSIDVTEVGEYSLRFFDASCDKRLDPISVVLFDESVVQVTPSERVVLDQSGTSTVTASGAESYEWYLGEDTSGALLSTTATLDVNNLGFYTLLATVGTCQIEKTIEVVEQDDQIIVPNLVSPNSDGINDTWQISNRFSFQPTVNVILYNANGKEIFNVTDYKNDWPSDNLGNQRIFYYKIIKDEVLIKAGTISVLD